MIKLIFYNEWCLYKYFLLLNFIKKFIFWIEYPIESNIKVWESIVYIQDKREKKKVKRIKNPILNLFKNDKDKIIIIRRKKMKNKSQVKTNKVSFRELWIEWNENGPRFAYKISSYYKIIWWWNSINIWIKIKNKKLLITYTHYTLHIHNQK